MLVVDVDENSASLTLLNGNFLKVGRHFAPRSKSNLIDLSLLADWLVFVEISRSAVFSRQHPFRT